MSEGAGDTILITGFPSPLARRLARKALEADARARVALLVREQRLRDAEDLRNAFGPARRRRLDVLVGDVTHMDLGLAGDEYRRLAATVSVIHHLAAADDPRLARETVERVNVRGTRGVLELADTAPGLRRVMHWSTVRVSGDRTGVVLEDELFVGQRFRDAAEETRCEAEKLAQAAGARLPLTVVRPGQVIGDSRTGEIDELDGPYHVIRLIVTAPPDIGLPLPGPAAAPAHLAPVDFVVDAAWHLARDARARGKTFHLLDPHPISYRHFFELCARRAGRKPPRAGVVPANLMRALLRAPGLERLTRAPRSLLEALDHQVFYSCRNTVEHLPASLVCPPPEAYAERIVRYVQDLQESRARGGAVEQPDPLDG